MWIVNCQSALLINFRFTCETKFTIRNSHFVISEGFEPSTFGVVNRRSIQLSYKIIFCNPRRARTFNLRRIRPMLQPIELWDYFNLVNGQLLIHLACQFLKSFCEKRFTVDHSHFWVSSGIEPCSPVPQTGALPNKRKKP